MTKPLAEQACESCRGDTPRLDTQAIAALQAQLTEGWAIEQGYQLKKCYQFADFNMALAFVNRIAAVAEQQNHHPLLELTWCVGANTAIMHQRINYVLSYVLPR